VPATDLSNTGISLHSGDIFAVHLVYDGTTLTMTITDTVTNATFTTSTALNIPGVVGGPWSPRKSPAGPTAINPHATNTGSRI
ncbi:MAG: hypothetical protein DMG58_15730, partial [Acidobacteria bacterium]